MTDLRTAKRLVQELEEERLSFQARHLVRKLAKVLTELENGGMSSPRPRPDSQLATRIVAKLGEWGRPMSVTEMARAMGVIESDETLFHYPPPHHPKAQAFKAAVDKLRNQGRLVRVGGGRGTKYRLIEVSDG